LDRVQLGIIGLGAIAQAIHLPNIARLWERFEIVHVCDLDAGLASQMASSLGPAVRSSDDPRLILDDPNVVAVLILASGPHAPVSRAALEAGKHVFVEKPLCLTVAEANELHDTAHAAERVLQVGYMKLYDPIASKAVTQAQSIMDPRLLRITVLHPTEASQQRHLSIRKSTVPRAALNAGRAYEAEMTALAIGDLPARFGWLYREVALGSMIHQVALARLPAGRLPPTVVFADAWPFDGASSHGTPGDPPTIIAMGEIAPGLHLEIDWVWLPDELDYLERYELFGPHARLVLDMPTPYALDQRAFLQVERRVGSEPSATRTAAGHRTGFQAELEAFHDAVTAGPPFPSGAQGAAQDTRFLQQLVGHLAQRHGFTSGGEARGVATAATLLTPGPPLLYP